MILMPVFSFLVGPFVTLPMTSCLFIEPQRVLFVTTKAVFSLAKTKTDECIFVSVVIVPRLNQSMGTVTG